MFWSEIPKPLAGYLAQALQAVSGAPVEAMPELKHPGHTYFAKVFYQGVPATETEEEQHWYLFCFQNSVELPDNSQGEVNRKKLETIGELASGVAHDFNNLIMGIQSNAEAMLAQPSLSPQARDSIVNIKRACANGASLTRSLLGYAKKQPLTLTPFNLIDLIHDVARIAGMASGGYRIALGKDFQEGAEPIMVVGSYSSLSHCLLNLIKNAREAMPDGGTIHVLWEGNETTANVTVRDHGAGHLRAGPRAHLRAVLLHQEAGHRARPRHGARHHRPARGHGGNPLDGRHGHLGLAGLAARRHVGQAAPPARRWSRAAPRTASSAIRSGSSCNPSGCRPNAHFLIYVIDDDDLVRDGLCSLLEHLGHRTHSFRHPEVALQALLDAEVAARGGHRRLQHAGHERRAVHRPLQHGRDRHAAREARRSSCS